MARSIIDMRNWIGGSVMLKKGLAVAAIVALLAVPALAQEKTKSLDEQVLEGKSLTADQKEAQKDKSKESETAKTHLGLALGFGLAIAAFGGALGQSNAIAKSVDAVARQPEAGARIQGMMIIGLALIETLVIYMLLICFMWGGKLGA
jgi:F-type H+-transporting ATPase subunit c